MPNGLKGLIEKEIKCYKLIASNLDENLISDILLAVEMLRQSIRSGGCIYFCGNGGSCSQSEHLAAELVGRYAKSRMPIKAVSLSTDMSVITCISNDFGFEKIFSRQLQALGCEKDCLVLLSTSGLSPNILEVSQTAYSLGIKRILLTGQASDEPVVDADITIRVSSADTARVQEIHLLIGHIMCKCLDNMFED